MAEVKISGGQAFEAKLEEIQRRLGVRGAVRVGFLEGATYPDGTPVALVAAVQNWGSLKQGIPPTHFFTRMVDDNKNDWTPTFLGMLKAGSDVPTALARMGVVMADQLRQSIIDQDGPPNAPSTVARKGFDKRLIESGHMLSSVDSELEL